MAEVGHPAGLLVKAVGALLAVPLVAVTPEALMAVEVPEGLMEEVKEEVSAEEAMEDGSGKRRD
jgi:hypothetical protein